MRSELLSILRCPVSGERLALEAIRAEGDHVIEGTLHAEHSRFTYPIVQGIDFDFEAHSGFYWYPIDLNDNSDWGDHKDELDDIEAIGFEFDIENTLTQACEFIVKFKAVTTPADPNNPPMPIVPQAYTLIIDGLVVEAGATRHVSYAESLGMIQNQAALKTIILSGRFDYLGYEHAGDGWVPIGESGTRRERPDHSFSDDHLPLRPGRTFVDGLEVRREVVPQAVYTLSAGGRNRTTVGSGCFPVDANRRVGL